MRIRPLASLLVLLTAACSSASSDEAKQPGAGDGTTDGGPSAGGGDVVAPLPPIVSSCAPADVVFGVPQFTAIDKDGYVRNIVTGDFNRDNKADVAVLVGGDRRGIEVFLGNGDGTFGKSTFYEDRIGNGFALAVADFDSDGRPDVLYGVFPGDESVDTAVGLRLGRSDGSFSAAKISEIGGTNLLGLAPAELNGDKKMDFVFAAGENPGKSGSVLNSGGGAFASANTSLEVETGWTVADLDGDGKADVVLPQAINGAASSICTRKGTGTGQFAEAVCYPAPSPEGQKIDRTAIGDVNGDGILDIAAIYSGANGLTTSASNIGVYLGKGDGTFGDVHAAKLPTSILGVKLVDVNNDKKADLVAFSASTETTGLVDILLSNGDGTLAEMPIEYAAGRNQGGSEHPVAVADYAANGLRGIVVQSSAKNGFDLIMATCAK